MMLRNRGYLSRYLQLVSSTHVLLLTTTLSLLCLVLLFPLFDIPGGMIDLQPGYDLASMLQTMARYGEQGRQQHLVASLTVDTLFPFAYSALLSGLIYRFAGSERLRQLALLPLIQCLLDLLENSQIVLLLLAYPDLGETQLEFTSGLTLLKHGLTAVNVGLALAVTLRAWKAKRAGDRTV